MIFEKKFGPVRNDETKYEIRPEREVMTLFSVTNIVATLKSQRLKWAGNVSRGPTYTDDYEMET